MNFEWFNKVLLAKIMWRFLHFHITLASRVLKWSYFPDSCILMSNWAYKASSIWNGILWGRKVILESSRWRSGLGSLMDVRRDHWIPRDWGFYVRDISRIPEGMRVSELKGDNGDWNVPLLRRVLCEDDLEGVLRIPRSLSTTQDEIIWHFSTDGTYSVRNGFRLMCESRCVAATSSPRRLEAWWEHL